MWSPSYMVTESLGDQGSMWMWNTHRINMSPRNHGTARVLFSKRVSRLSSHWHLLTLTVPPRSKCAGARSNGWLPICTLSMCNKFETILKVLHIDLYLVNMQQIWKYFPHRSHVDLYLVSMCNKFEKVFSTSVTSVYTLSMCNKFESIFYIGHIGLYLVSMCNKFESVFHIGHTEMQATAATQKPRHKCAATRSNGWLPLPHDLILTTANGLWFGRGGDEDDVFKWQACRVNGF